MISVIIMKLADCKIIEHNRCNNRVQVGCIFCSSEYAVNEVYIYDYKVEKSMKDAL